MSKELRSRLTGCSGVFLAGWHLFDVLNGTETPWTFPLIILGFLLVVLGTCTYPHQHP